VRVSQAGARMLAMGPASQPRPTHSLRGRLKYQESDDAITKERIGNIYDLSWERVRPLTLLPMVGTVRIVEYYPADG
jgi:hypothetical protein